MNTKMILNEDLSLLNDSESSITTLDEHPEESVQPPVIKIVDEVVVHKDEEKVQSINKKCGLETIDDCVNPTIINIDSKGKEGDSLLTDESFNCGICSETFETKSNYILHMQSHQEPSTFKCDKCGKSFNKQLELEWNTETEHEQQLSSNHQLPESNEEVTKTDHNDVEMQPLYSCELCDYDTENIDDLRNHVQRNVHSFKNNSFQEIVDIEVPGEVYICGECCAKFETFQACESHTKNHLSKCYKCDFKSDDIKKLKAHERTEHDLLTCNGKSHNGKCKVVPQPKNKEENDFQTMITHLRSFHGEPLFCNFCDFHGVTRGELAKHTFEYHEDQTILNTISDQVSDLSNSFASFEIFKEELKDVLLGIIQGQNTMKQELFLIRNHQVLSSPQPYIYTRSEPTTKTPASSSKTTTYPDNLEHTPLPPPGYSVRTPPSHTGHSKHTPRTLPDNSACAPPPPSSTSTPTPQAPRNTPKAPKQETERSRILFIGDSISANIDINALENATQKGFVTAKAYSSVFDTVTNAAKKAARFPNSNFTDAIPAQLRKSKFHSLILQAGSVD